jgi:hypothetical protein
VAKPVAAPTSGKTFSLSSIGFGTLFTGASPAAAAAAPATTDAGILSRQWRNRYQARSTRIAAQRNEQQSRREAVAANRSREAAADTKAAVQHWSPPETVLLNPAQAQSEIAAAVARAKARKAALQADNSH